jgi:hypothetical protein
MSEWEFLTAHREGGRLRPAPRREQHLRLVVQPRLRPRWPSCDGVPHHRVMQIHLAGHTNFGEYIIDTHSDHVIDPVWALYRRGHASAPAPSPRSSSGTTTSPLSPSSAPRPTRPAPSATRCSVPAPPELDRLQAFLSDAFRRPEPLPETPQLVPGCVEHVAGNSKPQPRAAGRHLPPPVLAAPPRLAASRTTRDFSICLAKSPSRPSPARISWPARRASPRSAISASTSSPSPSATPASTPRSAPPRWRWSATSTPSSTSSTAPSRLRSTRTSSPRLPEDAWERARIVLHPAPGPVSTSSTPYTISAWRSHARRRPARGASHAFARVARALPRRRGHPLRRARAPGLRAALRRSRRGEPLVPACERLAAEPRSGGRRGPRRAGGPVVPGVDGAPLHRRRDPRRRGRGRRLSSSRDQGPPADPGLRASAGAASPISPATSPPWSPPPPCAPASARSSSSTPRRASSSRRTPIPAVLRDLAALARSALAPEGHELRASTPRARTTCRATCAAAVTRTTETIPVVAGRLGLGTWQAHLPLGAPQGRRTGAAW